MKPTEKKPDSFRLASDAIIAHIEAGDVPWKKPWTDKGLPINLVSCKPYGALNHLLLNALDYPENMFLTMQQVHKIGGSVREGEMPHLAVYWKWPDAIAQQKLLADSKKPSPRLKCYSLYNLAQCFGIGDHHIPMRELRKKFHPIDVCKEVVSAMPLAPEIRHQGDRAYYQPVFDLVTLPAPERFANDEYYYSTLFKQLVYSLQNEKRLNHKATRTEVSQEGQQFTDAELVAEIASCYLCSYCGIDTWNFENHIEYAQGWIERFKSNSHCIVYAAIHAQKAIEYILGENASYKEAIKIEERQFETEVYE